MDFSRVENIVKFSRGALTEKAIAIATELKENLKVTVNGEIYVFEESSRLWVQKSNFYTELALFLLKKAKEIKELADREDIKLYCVCPPEERKKVCQKCSGVRMNEVIEEFDKKSFLVDMDSRIKGMVVDNEIHNKFDSVLVNHLPIKGGKKFDLRTMQITNIEKTDYCTYTCNVEYTEEQEHAEKFFESIMPIKEEREFLRRVLGYALTGDMKARVYFIFYGHGSNGKSVILKLLKLILGNYYVTCDKSIFAKPDRSGGCTEAICDLQGKRCGGYSEGETSDKVETNDSLIKAITGMDQIVGNPKFKKLVKFYATCKLIMATNYIPRINGAKADKDRINVIFFDQRFSKSPAKGEHKADDNFIDALETVYLNEVFSWIAKGAVEYYKDRTMKMPESFDTRTTKLVEDEDAITSFLKYGVKFTDNKSDYIKKADLFEHFKHYCNDNSLRCDPRSSLYARLMEHKMLSVKYNGYDVYRGMKINKNKEEKEEEEYDQGVNKADQSIHVNMILQRENEDLKSKVRDLQMQLFVLKAEKELSLMKAILEKFIQTTKNRQFEFPVEEEEEEEDTVPPFVFNVTKEQKPKTEKIINSFEEFFDSF